MTPPSYLSWQSDFMILNFDSEILEREDYWRVSTPRARDFHWGNFLLLKKVENVSTFDCLMKAFKKEFNEASVKHICIAWDYNPTETTLNSFKKAGFNIERTDFFSAQNLIKPQYFNKDLDVRPLRSDRDWKEATNIQLISMNEDKAYKDLDLEGFVTERMIRYRAMADAKFGNWYGAFFKNEMVGSMGLYSNGSIARYQAVDTVEAHRRKGVAQTMLYSAAKDLYKTYPGIPLLIAADVGKPSNKLYRKLGFQHIETQVGVCFT